MTPAITYRFAHCTVTIDDALERVRTQFNDGTSVFAVPNLDAESIRRAYRLGYTGGEERAVWEMTRWHDLLHTVIAEAEGHAFSPTCRRAWRLSAGARRGGARGAAGVVRPAASRFWGRGGFAGSKGGCAVRRLLVVAGVAMLAMLAMPAPAMALNRDRARELAFHGIRVRCGSRYYTCKGVSLHWLHGPRPRKYHAQYLFLGYTHEERNDRLLFLYRRRHSARAADFLPKYKTCAVSAGITQWGKYYAPRKSCLADGGQA